MTSEEIEADAIRVICVIVMDRDSDVGAPESFCEVQRDDSPDALPEDVPHPFETDEDAARWVSPATIGGGCPLDSDEERDAYRARHPE